MGDKTGIEWTDATWNPVTGCTKVSQGCKFCYAERVMKRFQPERKFTDVRLHEDRLDQPLRWRRARKVFVNSMSDLFHPDVPDEFIARVWNVMHQSPSHTFQLLTKRPERMRGWLSRCANADELGWITHNGTAPARAYDGTGIIVAADDNWPLSNVWLGVSVESPAHKSRIDELRRVYARVRFLSLEPLLEDLGELDLNGIDWVIVGGESGPKARPMHPDWVRSIRDQCAGAGVPFLFKQWGEWGPHFNICSRDQITAMYSDKARHTRLALDGTESSHGSLLIDVDEARLCRYGKKLAGRLLDGIEHNGYPTNHKDQP